MIKRENCPDVSHGRESALFSGWMGPLRDLMLDSYPRHELCAQGEDGDMLAVRREAQEKRDPAWMRTGLPLNFSLPGQMTCRQAGLYSFLEVKLSLRLSYSFSEIKPLSRRL
jgi:hypothetical protein